MAAIVLIVLVVANAAMTGYLFASQKALKKTVLMTNRLMRDFIEDRYESGRRAAAGTDGADGQSGD